MTDKREKKEKQDLQKRFAQHLRKVRKSLGLTSAELGRRCDIEKSNMSRLESGRMNPSLNMLKKLCEGMEIELTEFFKGFK